MISFSLFALSGITLVTLVVAKGIENRSGKRFFLLRAISKGDTRIRNLYHRSLNFYSDGKDKSLFFFKKQLPLKVKRGLTKSKALIQEKVESRFGNVRNSRLLKRQEGISEFFKNISEVEKGGGEINGHIYQPEPITPEAEPAPEPLAVRITPPTVATTFSRPAPVLNTIEPVENKKAAPRKPRAPRAPKLEKRAPIPRKRRLQVVELTDEPTDIL